MSEGLKTRIRRIFLGRSTGVGKRAPVVFESRLGREKGADPLPLALVGHLATLDLGRTIAEHSTLSCVSVENPEDLERLLDVCEVAGLFAQSRPMAKGEAGKAIEVFRRRFPEKRAVLYQAWDYNVERAAQRALEYGADGVVMPAIEMNEFFPLLFGVLERAGAGTPRPATVEEHRALLRQFAPRSKFWEIQDRAVSELY